MDDQEDQKLIKQAEKEISSRFSEGVLLDLGAQAITYLCQAVPMFYKGEDISSAQLLLDLQEISEVSIYPQNFCYLQKSLDQPVYKDLIKWYLSYCKKLRSKKDRNNKKNSEKEDGELIQKEKKLTILNPQSQGVLHIQKKPINIIKDDLNQQSSAILIIKKNQPQQGILHIQKQKETIDSTFKPVLTLGKEENKGTQRRNRKTIKQFQKDDQILNQQQQSIDTDDEKLEYQVRMQEQFQNMIQQMFQQRQQDQTNPMAYFQNPVQQCRFHPTCNNPQCRYFPCSSRTNEVQSIQQTEKVITTGTLCKYFPNCQFGEKCRYDHPTCKYGSKCLNSICPYKHTNAVE